MNINNIFKRITPLVLKIIGKLPNCPWSSILYPLNPRTIGIKTPPIDILEIDSYGEIKKLLFHNKHEMWFPRSTEINHELWSESLVSG